MEEDLLREIAKDLRHLRRLVVYTWITFGVALFLGVAVFAGVYAREVKHTERYAYYRQQYEGQKVWNLETSHRLRQLEAQVLTMEKTHAEMERQPAPAPAR